MNELELIGAIFAALLGLAFGSFLNVFLARFPEDESLLTPRSHCRHCEHMLSWWENLPVLSWIFLGGRCRACRAWIGIRYPLAELGVGTLWTLCWLRFVSPVAPMRLSLAFFAGYAILCWLLVALALLDAEYLWLPDWLTWPGIGLGVVFSTYALTFGVNWSQPARWIMAPVEILFRVLIAAGVVLIIRLAYWIVRRQEGMGLGDAKLMAMLGAWLGLRGAVECFVLAIFGAAAAAFLWLGFLALRRNTAGWAKMPLPLGTFLCAAALSQVFFPHWLLHRMHLDLLGLPN